MTTQTPAVYRRKPLEMSAKTWAWCAARWPGFADARRAQRASEAYERQQQSVVRRIRGISV